MSYVASANQYIQDVLAGAFPTNRWTRLACQRQLDDLARQNQPDFPYVFDEEAAEVPCAFLELLHHVAGEKGGEALKLEPWQCFVVTTVFGWRRKDNRVMRRFRRSFVECGKGNGKSFLSSGLGLYMLCADGETGAQVISAARASDQARLVFDVAYQQVLGNPELAQTFGLKPMKKGIAHLHTGSVMKPVSAQGKSLAGLLPYFVSLDETWAHRDRTVVDEMERGCAKRANSLLSTITHAGENLANVGHEQHEIACAILSKELRDEETFACIWSAEGFNWTSPDGWRAANPNWGVSVYPDQVEAAAERAQKIPALQAVFRSHNLCEWIGSDLRWLSPDKLAACREKNLAMDTFRFWHMGEPGILDPDVRRPFALGMDLASRQDIAAIIFTCMAYLNGVEHFYCFGRYYVPEHTIATSPIAAYKGWATRGLLITSPGYSNDYDQIQRDLLAIYNRYLGYATEVNPEGFNFVCMAYDQWQADQLAGNLMKAGIRAVPFEKTAKRYSPVMDWLQSLILEGRFHFSANDEVLLWALNNVVCHRDRNENVFPNKAAPERKIDPAVALLYSLAAAQANNFQLMRPPNGDGPRITFLMEDGSARLAENGNTRVLPPLQEAQHGQA